MANTHVWSSSISQCKSLYLSLCKNEQNNASLYTNCYNNDYYCSWQLLNRCHFKKALQTFDGYNSVLFYIRVTFYPFYCRFNIHRLKKFCIFAFSPNHIPHNKFSSSFVLHFCFPHVLLPSKFTGSPPLATIGVADTSPNFDLKRKYFL